MSEIYHFQCLECNLDLKVGRGVRGDYPSSSVRFYCEKCSFISFNHICEICEKHIERILYVKKQEIVNIYEEGGEIKADCPYCFSKNTVLTEIGKWHINNQIW